MQQHLFSHFCTTDCCSFLEDVSLTFIVWSASSDPLKKDDYERRTLKITAPFGFDIEGNVYYCLC